jgi:epoxyqueuosine reductase
MLTASIAFWISHRAKELGFSMTGVVRAEKFPELARNEEWLGRGYAGEMKYLNDDRRTDVREAMPGARSVIVCALTYNTDHLRTTESLEQSRLDEHDDAVPRGWISRYAWGDDYHEVLRVKLEIMLEGLRAQCNEPFEARVYADTGPINERVLAKHAGLGWLGKNTLLLNQQLGSYFFLGVILTSLDLPATLDAKDVPAADRCGTCRRCIDACPTEALIEPYVLDARKCISYLTIELRTSIPGEFREAIGQHVFGCDICQDVCPWNCQAPMTNAPEFQPRSFSRGVSKLEALQDQHLMPSGEIIPPPTMLAEVQKSLFMPSLEWLASLDERQFREMFRNSPIKRTKWKGLLRNVCIALGNSRPMNRQVYERVFERLTQLAKSDEPSVSESAQWAISRIQEPGGQQEPGMVS